MLLNFPRNVKHFFLLNSKLPLSTLYKNAPDCALRLLYITFILVQLKTVQHYLMIQNTILKTYLLSFLLTHIITFQLQLTLNLNQNGYILYSTSLYLTKTNLILSPLTNLHLLPFFVNLLQKLKKNSLNLTKLKLTKHEKATTFIAFLKLILVLLLQMIKLTTTIHTKLSTKLLVNLLVLST